MTMAELVEVFTSVNFVFGATFALAMGKVVRDSYSELFSRATDMDMSNNDEQQ